MSRRNSPDDKSRVRKRRGHGRFSAAATQRYAQAARIRREAKVWGTVSNSVVRHQSGLRVVLVMK